jgi:hypothetical protein
MILSESRTRPGHARDELFGIMLYSHQDGAPLKHDTSAVDAANGRATAGDAIDRQG